VLKHLSLTSKIILKIKRKCLSEKYNFVSIEAKDDAAYISMQVIRQRRVMPMEFILIEALNGEACNGM